MTRSHQEDAHLARATLAEAARTIAGIASNADDTTVLAALHVLDCLALADHSLKRMGRADDYIAPPMIQCLAVNLAPQDGDEYILVDAREAAE